MFNIKFCQYFQLSYTKYTCIAKIDTIARICLSVHSTAYFSPDEGKRASVWVVVSIITKHRLPENAQSGPSSLLPWIILFPNIECFIQAKRAGQYNPIGKRGFTEIGKTLRRSLCQLSWAERRKAAIRSGGRKWAKRGEKFWPQKMVTQITHASSSMQIVAFNRSLFFNFSPQHTFLWFSPVDAVCIVGKGGR